MSTMARMALSRFYSSSKRKEVERYLFRQASDQYSQRAKEHCYRARSAFKLVQINAKHRLIRPGQIALDIGAAPGSWCQVLSELIFPGEYSPRKSTSLDIMSRPMRQKVVRQSKSEQNPPASGRGYILGVDLLPIDPIGNVDLLCNADITRAATQAEIRRRLAGKQVDLVVSDMAPNPTGDSSTDHIRIIRLCQSLFEFTTATSGTDGGPIMAEGATLLCKIFDGPHRKELMEQLNKQFGTVTVVKPEASRNSSSEIYLLATYYFRKESNDF